MTYDEHHAASEPNTRAAARSASRTIHYGIVGDPNALDSGTLTSEGQMYLDGHRLGGLRTLPLGFLTDGDSFLCWGDNGLYPGAADYTLHVQRFTQLRPYVWDDTRPLAESNAAWDEERRLLEEIIEDRARLAGSLRPGERLSDYVCVTTTEDWSEESRTYVLEHFIR